MKRRLALGVALATATVYVLLRVHDRPPGPPGGWLRAAGLEERFLTVEGHRIRYVRKGQGRPVVLLHGFGSSLFTWKDVLPALAAEHDVVALDLPGFGWSDLPPDLSFGLYPRVVQGVLDALGVPRAAVVGNSMGGAVGAILAAEHPERVDRLVLVDAAGFNLRPEDRPVLVRLATHPLAESLLVALPVRRLLVEQGLAQVFHDPAKVTPERVEEYLAAASRPGALAALRSLGATSRIDPAAFAERLGRIAAPTLVVWGEADTWIPPGDADRFTAAVPGARKVMLPGVGHVPQEEDPEAVLAVVRPFLAEEETVVDSRRP